MKVIVPYVRLEPLLPKALELQGIEATYIGTSGGEGYWWCLAELWTDGETFICLEQDKIPQPGALEELWACPSPWCTFPVAMRGNGAISPYPSLACTKFGAELMEADPDLMLKVGELDLGFGVREWSRLDMGIAAFCENLSPCHWHEPGKVEHLHA